MPARVSGSGRLTMLIKPITALLNHRTQGVRFTGLAALCVTLCLVYYAAHKAINPAAELYSRRQMLASLNSAEKLDCYSTCQAEESMSTSVDRIHAMRRALAKPAVKHEHVLKAFEAKKRFPFIKAAYYFSEHDPTTFWSALKMSSVDAELQQIKDDGFNTIMIVLPWTDIQPTVDPMSYDQEILQKLGYLLEMAAHKGLYVAGRVGYMHNRNVVNTPFASWQLSHFERCTLLMQNHPTLKDAWIQYLSKLNEVLARYPATYMYSFLSWEDFACVDWVWPWHSHEERVKMARESGFQKYLEAQFKSFKEAKLELDVEITSFKEVPVPSAAQKTLRMHWARHFNSMWWSLVMDARQLLPFTSMELRMDDEPGKKDLAKPLEGDNIVWQPNAMHEDDISVTPRGAYYAPYMGAPNNNDLLSSEAAIRTLTWTLNKASGEGVNRRVVLDQFRFIDSSPQGKHHSQVDPAQLPAFLGEAAQVLKNMSVGYGLWAYRAYRRNELHNGAFQKRLDGWTVEGCCGWPIDTDSENVALYLHASNGPAGIRQAVTLPEGKCDNAAGTARLCLKAMSLSGDASLSVIWEENRLLVQPSSSSLQEHCLALPAKPEGRPTPFGLQVDSGTVLVDDLVLYCHVEQQGVYGVDGGELALAGAVRHMNAALPEESFVKLWAD